MLFSREKQKNKKEKKGNTPGAGRSIFDLK